MTEVNNSGVGGFVSDMGSVMSDVGDIYYKGFENLFGAHSGSAR